MPRFALPPDAQFEALLREAYDFMPGPDMARLAEIESRLLRGARRPVPRRRVSPPWWALLLLAGGAATAAWWAGERWLEPRAKLREQPAIEPGAEPGAAPPARQSFGDRPPDRSGAGTGQVQDQRSPIIDRREER
jgi:hypothetical protein